jgi:hypothetical protein
MTNSARGLHADSHLGLSCPLLMVDGAFHFFIGFLNSTKAGFVAMTGALWPQLRY